MVFIDLINNMKSKKAKAKKKKMPSTQTHLPIAEIREDVVILKDGTLRGVLMVSSVNFALKSEDEQNALISGYVGFLNSIDFPLQVVVQSRKMQVKPYLEKLAQIEREQANELLRIQTADYRAFVGELVDMGEIMTKRYYIVVPYDPVTNKKKSYWSRLKEVIKPHAALKLKDTKFQERKRDLNLRIRQVTSGLQSMGLNAAQLDTQALIELYYGTYNPDIAFTEPLTDIAQLRVEKM